MPKAFLAMLAALLTVLGAMHALPAITGGAKASTAPGEQSPRTGAAVLPAGFTPTAAAAPALAGIAPVASGIDEAANLAPAWGTGAVPGPEAPGVQGAFRFLCAPGQLSHDDPILYPGQPGKSHLHQWFGNTKGDAFSTYASLRTSGESTCNNLLNGSAYWIPAMIHPSGKVVKPDVVSIYYKRAPASSIYCAPPYAKACLPLPRGLRYVFGYNMLKPAKPDPPGFRWFNCPDGVVGQFPTIADAAKGCPAGKRLEAVVVGPNCWDGKNLDSADHRSHMAYQFYNGYHAAPVCPKTHPYLLPFFQLSAFYSNDGTAAQWLFSSDQMMKAAGGTTYHADWFGAWEDKVQEAWTVNCIDKALSCNGGDLGDGRQLKQLAGYADPKGPELVDAPAR